MVVDLTISTFPHRPLAFSSPNSIPGRLGAFTSHDGMGLIPKPMPQEDDEDEDAAPILEGGEDEEEAEPL
ncbi:unnamed protein product [Linum trigynum]|uniref:Uncharacterized protein n=1 Tax=Linum trigynum TaxID=586398 RepID=A0AAV2DKT1_9ROSI